MKSYLERLRRFGYAAPALAFIFALSLIIRMLPYDKVFVNGAVIFYEVDPYFFIRNIMYTASHFPGVLQVDYYQNYPGGGGGPYPFYILFASSIALIAGLGSPSPHTVEVVTALLPPVISALTIFPVYLIGKELFDSKAGIVGAAMLGLNNFFVLRTLVGYSDHDFLDVFLISLIVLFFLLAMKKAEGLRLGALTDAAGLKLSMLYSLLAGLFIACFAFEWSGGLLLNYIILAYAFLQFSIDRYYNKSSDALIFAGSMMFGTVAVIMGTVYLVSAPAWLPLLKVIDVLLVFIGFFLLGLFSKFLERRGSRWYIFPAAGLGASVVSLAIAFISSKEFSMYAGTSINAISGRKGLSVSETLSILDIKLTLPLDIMFLILVTIGFAYYIFSLRKTGNKDAGLFFAIWTFVLIAMFFIQIRFVRLLAINFAILTGFLFTRLFEFFKFKNDKHAGVFNFFVIAALLFIFITPQLTDISESIQYSPPYITASGINDALVWMKEYTPATSFYDNPSRKPEYGIMSWADYGYWITYVGRRPNFANPGQGNAAEAANFFALTNETEANKILERNNLRYVLTYREEGSLELFLSESKLIGSETYSILNKRFYDSLYMRMSLYDGTADKSPFMDDIEPLKHHRLVYESSPDSQNIIKIFEYVKGAAIKGTTGPGVEVTASASVVTNRGRTFEYTAREIADSKGNFTITVPYSVDSPYETKAVSPYNISAGVVSKKVEVKESDIMNGTVIDF